MMPLEDGVYAEIIERILMLLGVHMVLGVELVRARSRLIRASSLCFIFDTPSALKFLFNVKISCVSMWGR